MAWQWEQGFCLSLCQGQPSEAEWALLDDSVPVWVGSVAAELAQGSPRVQAWYAGPSHAPRFSHL